MHIHLGRVACGVGESDFVALFHQGANRDRELIEVIASALINLAIFQGQAATARDQYQDFSFCCHLILLSEIESVSRELILGFGRLPTTMAAGIRTSTTIDWPPNAGTVPSSDRTALGRTLRSSA